MKKINSNIQCPSCQNTLIPKVLGCDQCDLTITGNFEGNEFSFLSADDLHFLRIFIRFEGKISDMEKALGVSYPTVKAGLSNLKERLNLTEISSSSNLAREEQVDNQIKSDSLVDDLEKMERGEMDYQDVLSKIKKTRRKK